METEICDTDLGEMLYIANVSKESGFKAIQCDTEVIIQLLKELRSFRDSKKPKDYPGW